MGDWIRAGLAVLGGFGCGYLLDPVPAAATPTDAAAMRFSRELDRILEATARAHEHWSQLSFTAQDGCPEADVLADTAWWAASSRELGVANLIGALAHFSSPEAWLACEDLNALRVHVCPDHRASWGQPLPSLIAAITAANDALNYVAQAELREVQAAGLAALEPTSSAIEVYGTCSPGALRMMHTGVGMVLDAEGTWLCEAGALSRTARLSADLAAVCADVVLLIASDLAGRGFVSPDQLASLRHRLQAEVSRIEGRAPARSS